MARLEEVREAALFGRSIHVVAAQGERAAAAIRGLFGRLGIPLEGVGPVPPSLEEVFVALIEARDRAEGRRQEVRS